MAHSFILESIRALLHQRPLLTESISYDYKVPDDKEEQIFDLYLWLTLKQIMDTPKLMEPGLLKPGWDENTIEDLKAIVDDGLEKIVNAMHKDYLQAGAVAIASEIRHVYDAGRIDSDGVKKALGEDYKDFVKYWREFKKYGFITKDSSISRDKDKEWINIGREKMYSAAYKAFLKSGISLENLCDIGEKLFKLDIWPSLFAGKNWVKIAKEISKQSQAKGTMAKALQLDRVIDLVHNTGLMIDKSASFAKKGRYDWLLKALDFKKEATPWQMADRGSIPDSILGRLFKLTDLDGTREHPLKTKEELKKEKVKKDTKNQEEPPVITKKDKPTPTPDPKTWHQHPNGGGWVENTAKVADRASVAENAMVYGNAWVHGNAIIFDAQVCDNAEVYESAKVYGSARVCGNAKVYGDAEVFDGAKVADNAQVFGSAEVYHYAQVYDNAQVHGSAEVYNNAKVYESAKVYGDAQVHGSAEVYNNAKVYESAKVYGDALVYGNAKVHGSADVCGNAKVYGDANVSGLAKVHGSAIINGNDVVTAGEYTNDSQSTS